MYFLAVIVVLVLALLGQRRWRQGPCHVVSQIDADSTAKGKASLEAHGIEVVNVGRLENVKNIYDETAERAYGLARMVHVPQAQAVFLSGVDMPTLARLDRMEHDLRKPVVSAAAAMMWNALRLAGVSAPIPGFGRLLAEKR